MNNEVIICHYSNALVGWATYVLSVPLFISGVLSVIGWMFGVFTLVCYGGFLFTMNSIFVAIQGGLNAPFEDPMCPGHILPGPPCIAAFYIGSVVTMMVCYYLMKWKRPGIVYGVTMVIAIAVPPLVLVWFEYFSAWDVFIMLYAGVVTTAIFFWFMLAFILPEMQFMFTNSVIEWFQYSDRLYLTKSQIEAAEQDILVTRLLREEEAHRLAAKRERERINLPEWDIR